jgi:DNA-binding NarL/FixJ family response regulator
MRKEPSGARRILVIDDSEIILSRIKKALADDGHLVTVTTQTVGNARHLASCDLVIIDYHMPGLDGLSVFQALRAAASHLERAPLFYLYTSDDSLTKMYATMGFDGFFMNKGDEQALVQQVRSVFRLSQIRVLAQKSRSSSIPPPSPESVRPISVPPLPGVKRRDKT